MREYKLTAQEYEKLKNTDIREVEPSAVPDIRDIHVDTSLPEPERVAQVVEQMNGNPFVFRCGGILVKTSFAGTLPLQAVLEGCLEPAK